MVAFLSTPTNIIYNKHMPPSFEIYLAYVDPFDSEFDEINFTFRYDGGSLGDIWLNDSNIIKYEIVNNEYIKVIVNHIFDNVRWIRNKNSSLTIGLWIDEDLIDEIDIPVIHELSILRSCQYMTNRLINIMGDKGLAITHANFISIANQLSDLLSIKRPKDNYLLSYENYSSQTYENGLSANQTPTKYERNVTIFYDSCQSNMKRGAYSKVISVYGNTTNGTIAYDYSENAYVLNRVGPYANADNYIMYPIEEAYGEEDLIITAKIKSSHIAYNRIGFGFIDDEEKFTLIHIGHDSQTSALRLQTGQKNVGIGNQSEDSESLSATWYKIRINVEGSSYTAVLYDTNNGNILAAVSGYNGGLNYSTRKVGIILGCPSQSTCWIKDIEIGKPCQTLKIQNGTQVCNSYPFTNATKYLLSFRYLDNLGYDSGFYIGEADHNFIGSNIQTNQVCFSQNDGANQLATLGVSKQLRFNDFAIVRILRDGTNWLINWNDGAMVKSIIGDASNQLGFIKWSSSFASIYDMKLRLGEYLFYDDCSSAKGLKNYRYPLPIENQEVIADMNYDSNMNAYMLASPTTGSMKMFPIKDLNGLDCFELSAEIYIPADADNCTSVSLEIAATDGSTSASVGYCFGDGNLLRHGFINMDWDGNTYLVNDEFRDEWCYFKIIVNHDDISAEVYREDKKTLVASDTYCLTDLTGMFDSTAYATYRRYGIGIGWEPGAYGYIRNIQAKPLWNLLEEE